MNKNKYQLGLYRHYKGGKYRLLSIAASAVDGDHRDWAVYQSLADDRVWIRPVKEFFSTVKSKDTNQPRFEFLDQDEIESWEHKYKRALADYQNLLKQQAKEKQGFVKYALADFLQDILPIYDHLKLSLQGLNDQEKDNPWAEGVRHVLKQFKEILEARGVEEIKTIGCKFDHETMEAIGGSGDHVKQEVMPGYKLNGRLIRPAKVIVK